MATRKQILNSYQASMSNLFPAKPVLSKTALLTLQELASSICKLFQNEYSSNIFRPATPTEPLTLNTIVARLVISLLAAYVLSGREEIMLGVYDFVRAKVGCEHLQLG